MYSAICSALNGHMLSMFTINLLPQAHEEPKRNARVSQASVWDNLVMAGVLEISRRDNFFFIVADKRKGSPRM